MYRLIQFGSTTLPAYDYDWVAGTADTVEALVKTVGGPAFDAYGTGDAPASMPYTLRYECVAIGATHTALRTTLDALRALRGKRQKLYRQAESDSSQHWAWARLMEIQMRNTVMNKEMIWQPMLLVFQVMTGWHGTLHEESYNLTADGTTNCSADNNGNVAVVDAVLTITAGNADITEVTMTISSLCQFSYDGTIAAGESLVVDSGAFSILNDGSDAYADFVLGAGQSVLEWLRLQPGTSTVTIVLTGGGTGATADLDYYDGWA